MTIILRTPVTNVGRTKKMHPVVEVVLVVKSKGHYCYKAENILNR